MATKTPSLLIPNFQDRQQEVFAKSVKAVTDHLSSAVSGAPGSGLGGLASLQQEVSALAVTVQQLQAQVTNEYALYATPTIVSVVSDASVAITNDDGSLTWRVQVTVKLNADVDPGDYVEVEIRDVNSPDWQTQKAQGGVAYFVNVTPGEILDIRARTIGVGGVSQWAVLNDYEVEGRLPLTPTDVAVIVTTFTVTLTPAYINAAVSYQFYRSLAPVSDPLTEALYIGQGQTITDVGLLPSTTYYYYIDAVNAYGSSAFYSLTATTLDDATALLAALEAKIESSELAIALSTRINLIDESASMPGSVNARIATEATQRAQGDASLASQITTVSTNVGNNSAAIQTNLASINGVEARYTVKVEVDSNGKNYVGGFVVGATATEVDAYFQTDLFAIGAPGNQSYPFIFDTTDNVAYLDTAMIKNASITSAKIASLDSVLLFHGKTAWNDYTNEGYYIGLNPSNVPVVLFGNQYTYLDYLGGGGAGSSVGCKGQWFFNSNSSGSGQVQINTNTSYPLYAIGNTSSTAGAYMYCGNTASTSSGSYSEGVNGITLEATATGTPSGGHIRFIQYFNDPPTHSAPTGTLCMCAAGSTFSLYFRATSSTWTKVV